MGNDVIKIKANFYRIGLVSGKFFDFDSEDTIIFTENQIDVWYGGDPQNAVIFMKANVEYIEYENISVIEE